MKQPSLGRIVHYVGNNGLEYAAIIASTDVAGFANPGRVGLVVFDVYEVESGGTAVVFANHDEKQYAGTWHWPDYVPDGD